IPMNVDATLDRVIDYLLPVDGEEFPVTAMLMGNPMCCIFVDDFNALDWRRIGKSIENHPQFPDRANVVFIRVPSRKVIELRIWERGVGATSGSRTCSCAGGIAAMINGKAERDLQVLMEGGEVKIKWRADNEVVI